MRGLTLQGGGGQVPPYRRPGKGRIVEAPSLRGRMLSSPHPEGIEREGFRKCLPSRGKLLSNPHPEGLEGEDCGNTLPQGGECHVALVQKAWKGRVGKYLPSRGRMLSSPHPDGLKEVSPYLTRETLSNAFHMT